MKTPALSITSSVISILRKKPRIFYCLSLGYSRPQAIAVALSGITVGLIALPLALALGVASIPIYLAPPSYLRPSVFSQRSSAGSLFPSLEAAASKNAEASATAVPTSTKPSSAPAKSSRRPERVS